MCTKLISLVCVLVLASASYGVVIGDFGNGTDGLDGWTNESGSESTLSVSATGATLGSTALKVEVQGSAWYNHIADKVLDTGQIASILDGTYTKFSVDVTRFAAEGWSTTDAGWGWWTPESRLFCSLSAGAYNQYRVFKTVGSGREMLGANWYPSTLNSGGTFIAPGMLPWRNGVQYADPDGTLTAEWLLAGEVANLKAQLTDQGYIYNANGDLGLDGMDIRLLANVTCWNGPGPSTYYLDNAQLTPEPATMVLLGLGGLALIRRKR